MPLNYLNQEKRQEGMKNIYLPAVHYRIHTSIHSFHRLSYNRYTAPVKASSPQNFATFFISNHVSFP